MTTHLRYHLWEASDAGQNGHAVDVMEKLGITYQHRTPQSLGDQWWFWNCENIPDVLPPYLSELKVDPMEVIGYGLSVDDAIKILNYGK